MTCLALDDEPLALRVLENHLRRCPDLQPRGFFTDPNAAKKMLEQSPVELLFLDIEMPDTSGISFLRQLVPRPLVIFTTAYRRYAVEGFELAAVDYLVKPFDFARLRRAVDRANLRLSAEQTLLPEQFITVNSAYEVIKIPLDDLYVAEVYGDYLKIYLTGREKPILTLMSLKKLSEQLPEKGFTRVHRSFLVANAHVRSRQGKTLFVRGLAVPVGRTYLSAVRRLFAG